MIYKWLRPRLLFQPNVNVYDVFWLVNNNKSCIIWTNVILLLCVLETIVINTLIKCYLKLGTIYGKYYVVNISMSILVKIICTQSNWNDWIQQIIL